jgi:MoxR-like ATPase
MAIRPNLLGYERVTDAALLACHAREHVLLVGPPGTGKSLFARQLFGGFEGTTFSAQLSKWSDETVLFGPPNMKIMRERGTLEYATDGTALGANWLFLDEMFDASDVLLRTLLGILNERVFDRGAFSVDVPLESCVATSNYTRVNDVLDAVLDRFALRVEVPVLDDAQRAFLWDGKQFETAGGDDDGAGVVSLAGLSDARELARLGVQVPGDVRGVAMEFAKRAGWSPRRERKAAWIMKVRAAMDARMVVDLDDCASVLPFMLPLPQSGAGAGGLSAVQESARAELVALAEDRRQAEPQRRQLRAWQAKWIVEQTYPDGVEGVRALAAFIKELRGYTPVNDSIAAELRRLQEQVEGAHRGALAALGVLA